MEPKTDVVVELVGINGNVFFLSGTVSKALKVHGHADLANEMVGRLFQCDSYEEALRLFAEYVHVE